MKQEGRFQGSGAPFDSPKKLADIIRRGLKLIGRSSVIASMTAGMITNGSVTIGRRFSENSTVGATVFGLRSRPGDYFDERDIELAGFDVHNATPGANATDKMESYITPTNSRPSIGFHIDVLGRYDDFMDWVEGWAHDFILVIWADEGEIKAEADIIAPGLDFFVVPKSCLIRKPADKVLKIWEHIEQIQQGKE
ncbi:hypothetical protein LTR17_012419 [Elasticomyces elasticus]|nr:hypothetical protein LTR17_012419 [Elasticomyces elasticus]